MMAFPCLRSVLRRLALASLAASTLGILTGCVVTPEPLTEAELSAKADDSLRDSYAGQEPIRRPIDLGEAMARAVLYNLDQRVQQAEEVLRSRELVSANMAMLPGLVASAGYSWRSNVEASSSFDVSTGRQSLSTSTSSDRVLWTSDAALSWNVLDLGLSYVRAQQTADQVLASRELRRRVVARIVEDVRSSYWKALAAEYLQRDLARLEARARASLAQSRQLVENANVSPVSALAFQKEIYEIQDRLQTVEAEVVSSRAQLAALMNLPPGATFSLVRPRAAERPGAIPSVHEMMTTALRNRPEVRSQIYQQRIAELDGTSVLIETLPGINAVLAPNLTTNSFTLNTEWWRFGAQASWNLMKVFSLPAREAQSEARQGLEAVRLKALTASIALQVVVSRQRYEHARRRMQTAADFKSVQDAILKQLATSATLARTGEQELVREEMSALLGRARYDVALAEMQTNYAIIQTTMGRDPYPDLDAVDLDTLAKAFRARLAGRNMAKPGPVAEAIQPRDGGT